MLAVRLTRPTKAASADDSKVSVRLEPGQVLGVSVRYKLNDLLSYVEHQGECWVKCLNKKELKGGHSVWEFEVKVKGEKAAPPNPGGAVAQGNDDIPF